MSETLDNFLFLKKSSITIRTLLVVHSYRRTPILDTSQVTRLCLFRTFLPLLIKIHSLRSADSKYPLTADCLFVKSTNCKELVSNNL